MDALFAIARDAPLSTVLVLGGFLFLILALGGRLRGGLEIPSHRQKWSALIGSALVCVGVGLYFVTTAPTSPPVPPGDSDSTPATVAPTSDLDSEMHGDSFIEMISAQPVILYDSFDDDNGLWWTGNAKDAWLREKRRIADGQYIWDIEILQDDVFAWHVPDIQAVPGSYLTVRVAQSGETALMPEYGLIFRQTGEDLYAFTVREDGYFRCRLHQDGTWKTLLDWQKSAAFRPGTVNELTVASFEDYFQFAINGSYVGSMNNSVLESGNVGLIVALAKAGDSAVFTFDDFEVRATTPQ